MKSIYLSGPMNGLTTESSSHWRRLVAQRFEPDVECIDPAREFDYLEAGPDIDPITLVNADPVSTDEAIIIRDMFDVQRADLVLVNFLTQSEKVSIGSISELAWAVAWGKPVVVAMKPGDKHSHPMTIGRSIVVPTLDEAINITALLLNL